MDTFIVMKNKTKPKQYCWTFWNYFGHRQLCVEEIIWYCQGWWIVVTSNFHWGRSYFVGFIKFSIHAGDKFLIFKIRKDLKKNIFKKKKIYTYIFVLDQGSEKLLYIPMQKPCQITKTFWIAMLGGYKGFFAFRGWIQYIYGIFWSFRFELSFWTGNIFTYF